MKKIVEFFDWLEERMENVSENKNRMKKWSAHSSVNSS